MIRRAAALALLALATGAGPAAAGADQEATFQDDNHLIYVTKAQLVRHLDTLQGLGVDRLRITVLWKAIAPQPASRTRPDFDATNPDAYPQGIWTNYDNVVTEARKRGMDVNFNITGPSPLWANKPAPRDDIVDRYEPSPLEFARFVVAAGRRYSGDWPPSPYVADGDKLPRVAYWSIWNEPNHSGWLTPTWEQRDGVFVERSASLYRALLDSAWAALEATGHEGDTVLVGETAPSGDRSKDVKRYMKPLIFIRALYCVDRRFRPLTGARAARLECPADPAQMRALHPGLFEMAGFAHHPYQLVTAPQVKPKDRDYVTIGVLPRLTRTLDRIFKRYGLSRRLKIYLTEFGYQTFPDLLGLTTGQQAKFINQSEYIAWRNRRVKTLSQFLLFDDGPPINLTFQSGLRTNDGKDKPSLAAYRMPIWLTGRGARTRLWGVLRPAAAGARERAEVQFKRRGSRRWRRLRFVTSTGPRNVLRANVRVPRGRGTVRLAWKGLTSRRVRVR